MELFRILTDVPWSTVVVDPVGIVDEKIGPLVGSESNCSDSGNWWAARLDGVADELEYLLVVVAVTRAVEGLIPSFDVWVTILVDSAP